MSAFVFTCGVPHVLLCCVRWLPLQHMEVCVHVNTYTWIQVNAIILWYILFCLLVISCFCQLLRAKSLCESFFVFIF